MGLSPGFLEWKFSYAISPIIFVGGIAMNMEGGQLPIISITDAGSFSNGPLGQFGIGISGGFGISTPFGDIGVSGSVGIGADFGDNGTSASLDDYFAVYEPAAGGTLEDFEFGHYPFANQSVAANAAIQEPLTVSMVMVCPVRGDFTWDDHLSIITSLQSVMQQHAVLGGSYTVATPKFIYTGCLLTKMTDITAGESKQPQSRFRLDFEQPLITLAQAQQAQNGLMSKMSSGTQMLGQPMTALSSLAEGAIPPIGIPLSGGIPLLGQPLNLATLASVPASIAATAAGVVDAATGLYSGVSSVLSGSVSASIGASASVALPVIGNVSAGAGVTVGPGGISVGGGVSF